MRKKYLPIISISLLPILLFFLWQYPSTIPVFGIAFLLFSLAVAVSSIFKKQREAYLQGKVTRGIFARNVILETFGILLTLTLAGLFGRTIAVIATEPIQHDLTKLIAGMVIGLLVGMGVGILMKRTWGRMIKSTLES